MKKVITLIITLLISLSVLVSCSELDDVLSSLGGDFTDPEQNPTPTPTPTPDPTPDTDDSNPDDSGVYTDFTADEKALFVSYVGEVIPFIENTEYYVEDCRSEYDAINFWVVGVTQAEFNAYLDLYSDYTLIETYEDDWGDTCYVYRKNNAEVDVSWYYSEDYKTYIIDAYVYPASDGGDDSNPDDSNPDDSNPDDSNPDDSGVYTDFTADEKALFVSYVGEVIPFIENTEYYVEDCRSEYGDINFWVVGVTQAEFNAYLDLYSDYTLVETYEDDWGDTCYVYRKNNAEVDISWFYYDEVEAYIIDAYVYPASDGGDDSNPDDSGDDSSSDPNVMTNNGKGLPKDTDGVYDVDFTDADIVKDVTDQGYYLDGCPTTGAPGVLVIPVQFSDVTAASKGYDISSIVKAFSGSAGDTDYYSVHDYYYISSYGKLDLDITVVDYWFQPKYSSSYYENQTIDYYGSETAIGDQLVLDEALCELAKTMDLSAFDSDSNGIIDAVVLVTTLEIDENSDFNWAYRYWNIYTDDDGNYYEYDGVSANDYLWASYQFLYEDENGGFNDEDAMNTYTFIHEFGHILGADDYYDTSYEGTVMDGHDIMDGMLGDHNAYTKFNFGWLTESRLVVTDSSVTLTLEDFSKNGDTIILANNWDDTLGAYQEYYIVVYYTNNELNSDAGGYFLTDGIVVYHVNSALYKETEGGETYYDVYNNNTSPTDEYGTEDNLIEFVKTAGGNYVFTEGATLPTVTDDFGEQLAYTFTVDSLTSDTATVTFTKIA